MRKASFNLKDLRYGLERSVERAEAAVLDLMDADAPRSHLIEAQDGLSDAVGNLAAYLLATGEGGWIRRTRSTADDWSAEVAGHLPV
jgi:hypothetical protein